MRYLAGLAAALSCRWLPRMEGDCSRGLALSAWSAQNVGPESLQTVEPSRSGAPQSGVSYPQCAGKGLRTGLQECVKALAALLAERMRGRIRIDALTHQNLEALSARADPLELRKMRVKVESLHARQQAVAIAGRFDVDGRW